MDEEKIFALADCNSFYCSCERVFRPDLKNRPVGVLSNNDGCFVSLSKELKDIGLPMGAPYFKFKDIIRKNRVAVFSSNYVLYGDMSARVMKILRELCPQTSPYSIDEAFLDLSDFKSIKVHEYAKEIRRILLRDTGLPVSIGVAPTKVLAKIANHCAKRHANSGGTFDLCNPFVRDEVLKQTSVENIWGIGRRSAAHLYSYNIRTAWDLKNADERLVRKLLSISGWRIQQELSGRSCIDINSLDHDKKGILSSRSFGKAVYEINDLREAVANHVSMAAEKLRKQSSICHGISVFIHTNRFKGVPQFNQRGFRKIFAGTSVTPKLIKEAFSILDEIFEHGFEYKKCGIMLVELKKQNRAQLDLFAAHDSAKEAKVMQIVDLINKKQGRGSIKTAACGTYNDWKMLSQLRSPCYTTRWSELLQVR